MTNEGKLYRSKEIVKVVEYEKGIEAGFFTRYTDGEKNEDGSLSTWGFSHDGYKKIQVPFVIDKESRMIFCGEGYMILEYDDGSLRSMPKKEFEEKYELINQ